MNKAIEELMWAVAESDDPRAEADFIARYPQMRAQLATRKAMHEVLRNAKPDPSVPPPFREPRPVAPRTRWLVPAAAILLFGVAFGAYSVTRMLTAKAQEPVVRRPLLAPRQRPTQPQAIPLDIPQQNDDLGIARRPVPPSETGNVVVEADKLTLFSAIDAVRKQAHIQIEVMPGVEDSKLIAAANRPDGTLSLAPKDLLDLAEAGAPIRVFDAGPDGYLILPMDKVENADTRRSGQPEVAPMDSGEDAPKRQSEAKPKTQIKDMRPND
jgi:hypothetical protein